MDLEVFIVCHDQDIILKDEETKKFSSKLPCYRYLFVGNSSSSKIENNPKVIICNKLPNNIENEKNLVSFTAWYALAKNDITTAKYVSVIEYDVDLGADFYDKNLDVLSRTNGIVGYTVFPLLSNIYLDAAPCLKESLLKAYNINLLEFITEYVNKTGKNSWCSSSNASLSLDHLKLFVDWFMPVAEIIKSDKLGGHVHERTIKIFAILNEIKTYCINGIFVHLQLKSHGIEALI